MSKIKIQEFNWSNENSYQIIIAILLFTIGFIYAYEPSFSYEYSSDIVVEDATYFRLVYIGSSGCVFSNNEKTDLMVKKLKTHFRLFAHEHGYKFLSTGIAMDTFANQGIEFLSNSGYYDELITGIDWFNLGAEKYIWDTSLSGYPDTPQILLTLTKYKIRPAGGELGNIEREDILLERVTGMEDINELQEYIEKSSADEILHRLNLTNHY